MSFEGAAKSVYDALSVGDEACAMALLTNDAAATARDAHGRTLLMLAAAHGASALIERLLERGAPLEAQDRWGLSACTVAAIFGRDASVKILLDGGADPEMKGLGGLTIAHWAVEFGRTRVLKVLRAHGANLDVRDARGGSPLHQAVSSNDLNLVRGLLSLGADPNLEFELPESESMKRLREADSRFAKRVYTSLSMALDNRNIEVSKLLLEHGAKATLDMPSVMRQLNPTESCELEALLRMATGTELHAAARAGDRDAVLLLVGRGAELQNWDEWGATPLHAAIRGGSESCVDALVRAGAELEALNRQHRTPLGYAAALGTLPLVRLLLARGADPHARGTDGASALYLAAEEGHQEVARCLIEAGAPVDLVEAILLEDYDTAHRLLVAGADPNAPHRAGLHPLKAAARRGSVGMIRLLLQSGARVNLEPSDERSALLLAAIDGHLEAARELLAAGADPDPVGSLLTPLGGAVEKGHVSVVRLLLAHGADSTATYFGSTLLELAVSQDAPEVVEALLEAGADPNYGAGLSGTPLMTAVRNGSVECAHRLLKYGALPDAENRWGRTPLGLAEAEGPPEMAVFLREFGAQVSKNPSFVPDIARRADRLRPPLECLFEYRRLFPANPALYPAFLEQLLAPALEAGAFPDDLLANALGRGEAAPLEALMFLDRLREAGANRRS